MFSSEVTEPVEVRSTPLPNFLLKPVEGKPNLYLLGGLIRHCANGTIISLFTFTCLIDEYVT